MSLSLATRVLIGAVSGSVTVVAHYGIVRFCRKKAAQVSLELLKELDAILELARAQKVKLLDYQEYCATEIRFAIETNMSWSKDVDSIRTALAAFHNDILTHVAKETN